MRHTTYLRRTEQVAKIVRAEKGVALACDAIEMQLRRKKGSMPGIKIGATHP